jgi:hypothetical protein
MAKYMLDKTYLPSFTIPKALWNPCLLLIPRIFALGPLFAHRYPGFASTESHTPVETIPITHMLA